MNENCCRNRCLEIAVITGILLGIVAAFLSYSSIITVSSTFLWASQIAAAAALVAVLFISAFADGKVIRCLNYVFTILITAIFGTFLSGLILILLPGTTVGVAVAVLVGLLFNFLTLIVTVTTCFIRCMLKN